MFPKGMGLQGENVSSVFKKEKSLGVTTEQLAAKK